MPKCCGERKSRCAKATTALCGLFALGAGAATGTFLAVRSIANSLMDSTIKLTGITVRGKLNKESIIVKNVTFDIPVKSAFSNASQKTFPTHFGTISSVAAGIEVLLVLAVAFLIATQLKNYVCNNSQRTHSESENKIADQMERGRIVHQNRGVI